MKRFLIVFINLLFVLLITSGCENAVEKELVEYANNSAYKIDHERFEMVEKVNKSIDDENVSAADFVILLEGEIIPRFEQLRLKLSSMELKTKEVRELNDIFIKTFVAYTVFYEYSALASKPDADPELKIKVTKSSSEADHLWDLWFRERQTLLEKFGYSTD